MNEHTSKRGHRIRGPDGSGEHGEDGMDALTHVVAGTPPFTAVSLDCQRRTRRVVT